MKRIDGNLFIEVESATGFYGEKLELATGIVYATVFLGKIPSRSDLAYYLGTSQKLVNRTIREVEIYPLATQMVLKGLYISPHEEPHERYVARQYLSGFFPASAICDKELFLGFNIMLEYLWVVMTGSEDSIDEYVRVRFAPHHNAMNSVRALIDVIYEYNRHLHDVLHAPDYAATCKRLAEGARVTFVQVLKKGGSANIAKIRLKAMLGK